MKRFIFGLIVGSLIQVSLYAQDISNLEIQRWNDIGIKTYNIKKWHEKANVRSVNEAKKWRKLVYGPFNHKFGAYDVKRWKDAGIKTPEEVKLWKDNHILSQEARRWKKYGINSPKEAKIWKNLNINTYYVSQAVKMNINPSKIKNLIKKGIKLEHIIKLKEWDISFTPLIESMSYSNKIFGQELYFTQIIP